MSRRHPQRASLVDRFFGTRLMCLMLLLVSSGCASGLFPKPQAQATLLALEDHGLSAGSTARAALPLTLVVEVPRAAAGYDTRNMAYLRRAHEIEYFAVHQWVDTPAQMLAPLMTQALRRSGVVRAAVLAPTAAVGELRLESELVRLQQDFRHTPSQVRLTVRVLLVHAPTRRALAWRELDVSTVSASEDPYGGAVAASAAVTRLLQQLVTFVDEAAPR